MIIEKEYKNIREIKCTKRTTRAPLVCKLTKVGKEKAGIFIETQKGDVRITGKPPYTCKAIFKVYRNFDEKRGIRVRAIRTKLECEGDAKV